MTHPDVALDDFERQVWRIAADLALNGKRISPLGVDNELPRNTPGRITDAWTALIDKGYLHFDFGYRVFVWPQDGVPISAF